MGSLGIAADAYIQPMRPHVSAAWRRKLDIEINRDPAAPATAPWLAEPSAGTWLSHPPLEALAVKDAAGSWSSRPQEGKWVTQELDAFSSCGTVTVIEKREVPSLPLEEVKQEVRPNSAASGLSGISADGLKYFKATPEGSLPLKLIALRAEALRLEASGNEAKLANEKLLSDNQELGLEMEKLVALASPDSTPH
jgi:hypothetical protein